MASVIRTIITILYAIDCVAMIVIILMQQGKSQGLGALAGASSSDTYWSKNKGRSEEGRLKKLTRALAVIFLVLSVILNINF